MLGSLTNKQAARVLTTPKAALTTTLQHGALNGMAEAILRQKQCSTCMAQKPLSEFWRHRSQRDGLRSQCKPCIRCRYDTAEYKVMLARRIVSPDATRKTKLKQRYGMSVADYEQLLAAQGGRCGICRTDTPNGRWARFHVDHDHATGEVRGLLCQRCNVALGRLGDDIEGAYRLFAYLKRTKGHARDAH